MTTAQRFPILIVATVALLDGCRVKRQQDASGVPEDSSHVTPLQRQSAPLPQDTLSIDSTPQDPYAELDRRGTYIDSVFRSTFGESPRMGWFLSTHFLAAEKHAQVYVYSTDSVIRVAQYHRLLSFTEHRALARAERLACETKGPLADYQSDATMAPTVKRAFYTSRLPAGPVHAGFSRTSVPPEQATAVRALLQADRSPALYLSEALTVSGKASYSFHATYDSSTHELLKTALVLHDSAGRLLSHDLADATAFECDGCGAPTYEEGLTRLYSVLNAFELPGFAHPLLLLDTGTVEGRAISFVTFTPRGEYSEYRIYEYVVNC